MSDTLAPLRRQRLAPVRRVPADATSRTATGTSQAASNGQPELRPISAYRGAVLAFIDEAGQPGSAALATLAAARQLADTSGAPMVCLHLDGSEHGGLRGTGIDATLALDGSFALLGLAGASGLAEIVSAFEPRHIVFPDRVPGGGVAGRMLAARLGVHPNAGVVEIAGESAICRCSEAGFDVTEPLARIMLVDPGFPLPLRQRNSAMEALALTDARARPEVEDLGVSEAIGADLPVSEAPFVISGGAGVRDWTLFDACARALNAATGASRVVVDAGAMPRERQIGASGTTTAAEFYLAIGISGAVQHLEGIVACKHVVSVNTDPDCAMAARADLAIVADGHAVMQALRRKLAERR